MHSIATIFILILIIILANNICCVPLEYRPRIANDKIIMYSFGALIFFGLSDLTNIFRLCDIEIFNEKKYLYDILYESCLYFWRIGQICVYMLFIFRMKHSFATTQYQSPFWHFLILYVLMVIFMFIQIIFTIEDYILFNGYHVLSNKGNSKFESVNIWSTEIVDLIISITLLYLYFSKLIRLNIDIVDGLKHSASRNRVCGTPTNSELIINQQQSIIGIMSKFTILSTFVIIFSQLFVFIIGLGYWICPGYNADDDQVLDDKTTCITQWRNGWRALWAIVNMINCLCIFLSFDFLTGTYYKICGLCDHCCRAFMKETFNKKNQEIQDILDNESVLDDSLYDGEIQENGVLIYNPNAFGNIQNPNDYKEKLLDIPLSTSTTNMSQKESTDMQYHHTIAGHISSLYDDSKINDIVDM